MKSMTLIQRFSIISLIAMILSGFTFGKIFSSSMGHHMFQKSIRDTVEIVNKNVIKHFKTSELITVKSASKYNKFSHKIGHLTLGTHIERIKIWNRDKVLVWSDDRELVGERYPDYEELEEAFNGKIVHEVSTFKEFKQEYQFEHTFENLLELYVPIRYDPEGDINTVFEIYQNIDPVYISISKHKRLIWFWTFVGFTSLYLVFFGIVWNASRRIDRQTEEIRKSKHDWEETFNSITDMITVHDRDYNIIQSNSTARNSLGLPSLNASTKCYKCFHGTEQPPEWCAGDQCVQGGEAASIEVYEPHLQKYIEIRAIPRIDEDNNADGFIHVVRDISKRKYDENLIQTHLNRLNALRSIDKAIIGSMDFKMTLDIFLDQVITHLKIDAASVLLLNKHTHTLEYFMSKGFRSRALKHTKLRLGQSNAGRAAMERRIVIIENLKENTDGFAHSPNFAHEDFVSYFAVPLIAKGEVKGVLELFHRSAKEAGEDWLEFLEAIADQGAIAIDNSTLFNELQQSNVELVLAYDTTIEGWSRALDLRDKETEGHTQRVSEMTVYIARELGMTEENIVHFRRGALLHDIGKMGIPDSILLKPGALSDEEWNIMKLHPVYAHQMLYPIEYLRPSIDIPYYHHEKWDGTGYPEGLKGEEIPVSARIFAIVDVWDALRSDRPYRAAWPIEKVMEHMQSLSGTHFDPRIIEVFLKIINAFEESDDSQSMANTVPMDAAMPAEDKLNN